MRDNPTSFALRARNDPDLYALLQQIYQGYDLLTHGGSVFPVAKIDVSRHQWDDPESILGRLTQTSEEADPYLLDAGQRYIDFLLESGRPIRNLPTFCLDAIRQEPDGSLEIDCSIGCYLDALRTCDSLEWELLKAIAGWPETGRAFDSFSKAHLPLRNHVHHRAGGDPVFHPAGRSAALAVSTLILFRRQENDFDDYAILIGERSAQKADVRGDRYHVIPSFMFQPVLGQAEREFVITHHVFREYLEELFNIPEASLSSTQSTPDHFYRNPNLLFLRRLMDKGQAKLLLTGLAVNLLNLRPEICTLLYIGSPQWYECHKTGKGHLSKIIFNEEWERADKGLSEGPECLSLNLLEGFGLKPENTVPPGAAAVFFGLKVAHELQLLR